MTMRLRVASLLSAIALCIISNHVTIATVAVPNTDSPPGVTIRNSAQPDDNLSEILTELCGAPSVNLLADETESTLADPTRLGLEASAATWLVHDLAGCATVPAVNIGLWSDTIHWLQLRQVPSESLASNVAAEITQATPQGWSLPDNVVTGLPSDVPGQATILIWDGEPARDFTPDQAWLSMYMDQLMQALTSLPAGSELSFLILRPAAESANEGPYVPLWSQLIGGGYADVLHANDADDLTRQLDDVLGDAATRAPPSTPSPTTTASTSTTSASTAGSSAELEKSTGHGAAYLVVSIAAVIVVIAALGSVFAFVRLRRLRLFGWLFPGGAPPVDLSSFAGRAILGSRGNVHLEGDGVHDRHAELRATRLHGEDDVLVIRPLNGPVVVRRKRQRLPVLVDMVILDRDTIEIGNTSVSFRLLQIHKKEGVQG